ncbi:MAG TPA: hypothetical protein VJS45_14485 [Acidimicrobiia bacterium]|nr:hypothetical protein [Acidimicrobiia bacterium]
MVGTAVRRWWPVLLMVLCFPVASAATLSITGGTLGSGTAKPGTCDSAPTVVQNVGTASPNTTNIVSVDVSGIVAACGGGTVRVAVYNNTDAVQEATKAIPAGGGSVNLPLTTGVPLKDSHFVAVTLQGP